MSAKTFFKSTSFKCIAVLLSILLICGILLTICNALFKVTDEERRNRAISKIYGKDITVTEIDGIDEALLEQQNAEILEYYKDENGDYLIKSTGFGGYDNGSVTCWVVVEVEDNAVSGIYKVVIDSNVGQSYINRVTDSALGEFSTAFDPEKDFSQDMITGATTVMTKTAICNSVNGAMNFVRQAILGESTVPNPYEDFEYSEYIDGYQTTHELGENGAIVYHIVTTPVGPAQAFTIDITVGADKTITAYEIIKNGSSPASFGDMMHELAKNLVGKKLEDITALYKEGNINWTEATDEIKTGATCSNTACFAAAAFALANYDNALNTLWAYTDNIDVDKTTYTVTDTSVEYTITTLQIGPAGAFEIKITVGADKTITAYEIVKNGSNPASFGDMMHELTANLVGKKLEDITALYKEGNINWTEATDEIKSGATCSNTACFAAAAYALANYDLAILLGGNA